MLIKRKPGRKVTEIVALEDLVPEERLLRKIDAAVDFERSYKMVEPLCWDIAIHQAVIPDGNRY